MPKKGPVHDDDGGGWTKVPEAKSISHKKRMEEKAAADKLAAEFEKHQQMGANVCFLLFKTIIVNSLIESQVT